MENIEYYEGLYNFLSKTPSGLKSEKGNVVFLIQKDNLIFSLGDRATVRHKILERTITNHYLLIEGRPLIPNISEEKRYIFKLEKTKAVDALGKPLFNVKYGGSEGYFSLFLIKPEEN